MADEITSTQAIKVVDSGAQSPALDRALALLEFISDHAEGVTTADIRTGLGFSSNLVFRLTKALMAHDYVERDSQTRRYALTRKLLTLAQPKREERSLTQIAWKPLRWLRDATGESAHIGVISGLECIVLDRVVGGHPYKCFVDVGAHGPLHSGAPGKVMLAEMPPAELEQALDQMELTRFTSTTITSRTVLERHLAKVKKQGYATDRGEGLESFNCLGAPVFDAEDRAMASVWITGPAPRLTPSDEKRYAPFVIEAAQMVTDALK